MNLVERKIINNLQNKNKKLKSKLKLQKKIQKKLQKKKFAIIQQINAKLIKKTTRTTIKQLYFT